MAQKRNSRMSDSNINILNELILLICGYVREKEQEYKFFMNVPDGILKIMHELYPLLLFKFGEHRKNVFKVNDDRTELKGSGNCSGYLCYADLEQYNDTGFNKGVHLWSIKFLGDCSCFLSVGVTTEKNDTLINKWNGPNGARAHWIYDGYNSYYKGYDDWLRNKVITLKLDCNNWTVTYYKDDKEYKVDNIKKDKSYFLAVICCGIDSYSHMKIVESPKF